MNPKITTALLLAWPLILLSGCSAADEPAGEPQSRIIHTQYEEIRLVTVTDNLDYPWSVAFLPDGRMLLTELPGRLNLLDREGERTVLQGLPEIGGVPERFQNHPVRVQGQVAGLTEVSVHPDYEENGWIYFTYTTGDELDEHDRPLVALAMSRARIDGDRLVDVEELFVQNRFEPPGRHYGSRIAWTHDGKLLLSLGGTSLGPAEPENSWPQNLGDHAGKILRLNDDGTVPEDNPFVGREGVLPEIYSYGHRNIQGLAVHPETGEIWAVEHGPRGGDELNRIVAGGNYGWPLVTVGVHYGDQSFPPYAIARRDVEGMIDPFYEFQPAQAPSGLAIVSSEQFPSWQGNFLVGGLRSERIRRLLPRDGEIVHDEELLLREIGRIRDVRQAPDGNIYVIRELPSGDVTRVRDRGDGVLYRIEPY